MELQNNILFKYKRHAETIYRVAPMANSSQIRFDVIAITNMTKINDVKPTHQIILLLRTRDKFIFGRTNKFHRDDKRVRWLYPAAAYIHRSHFGNDTGVCIYLLRQCVGIAHKVNQSHSSYSGWDLYSEVLFYLSSYLKEELYLEMVSTPQHCRYITILLYKVIKFKFKCTIQTV